VRPTIELIGILEREAANFAGSTTAQTKIGIAVRVKEGGPVGDTVVWHDAKDRQAVLEILLKNGGEPVGLIGIADYVSRVGGITIYSSLFEEYREDLAAKTALKKICLEWGHEIRRQLAQCGGTKAISFGDSSDWLQ
jgi:hypothetical protein